MAVPIPTPIPAPDNLFRLRPPPAVAVLCDAVEAADVLDPVEVELCALDEVVVELELDELDVALAPPDEEVLFPTRPLPYAFVPPPSRAQVIPRMMCCWNVAFCHAAARQLLPPESNVSKGTDWNSGGQERYRMSGRR